MNSIKIMLPMTLLLFSCGKEARLENFDSEGWKKDKYGCNGIRQKEADILLEQRKSLQGVPEHNILKLLGRPDRNEFYERHTKSMVYFIEPGGQCSEIEGKNGKRIKIELNSLGNVTWINEENL